MKMIDRIKQAMRDTGVCDGMSDEDLDIAVTAALEAMREPERTMLAICPAWVVRSWFIIEHPNKL